MDAPDGGAGTVRPSPMPPASRIGAIELLRAVAVLMVVFYHALVVLPDPLRARAAVPAPLYVGYAGVDLFFVISGFVIMHATRRWRGMAHFAWARVSRILPCYWLVTLLVAAAWLASPRLVPVRAGSMGPALAQSLLLVPEVYRPLLGVGWTLQHELIFYAVAGLAMAAGLRRRLPLILLALFVMGVALHVVAPTPIWDHKLFALYWLEFALGVVAFRVAEGRGALPARRLIAGAAALTLVTGWLATPLLPPDLEVPVLAAGGFGLVRVIGFGGASCLLLLGMIALERRGRLEGPAARLLQRIGGASYLVYLLHNPLLQIAGVAAHRLHLGPVGSGAVLVLTMPALVSGCLALHRHAERPLTAWLRDLPDRLHPRPWPTATQAA